jgi:thiaminase/transcriptional activator TenA
VEEPPAGSSFAAEVRTAADELWRAQLAHPFVRGIADGSLDAERFRHFVRQDYLFLVDYARALSTASAKAPRLDWQRRFAALAHETLETEMALHVRYAAGWGIGAEELAAEVAGPTTRAYTGFLLETAAAGGFAELTAALLPCMWGYSWLGRELAAEPPVEGNPYADWTETYASEEFAELASWCREVVDEAAAVADEPTRQAMREAFLACSRHELAFWDASWRLEQPAL